MFFASFLSGDDARRATDVITAIRSHGVACALTGGLAIDAQLQAHGRTVERRALNDIDFVVEERTLSRTVRLEDTGTLPIVSVEDLVARTTALVYGRLRRGSAIDVKHAAAFNRLRGLGRPEQLASAWSDHRQQIPGTLDAAARETARLLAARPDLVVVEKYSCVPSRCEHCRPHGRFRPAPAGRIVEILGYW